MHMKEFTLLKIYLVIISVVWLIWAVIGYGNFWYQIIKHAIITPEEYVQWSYDNYLITQCKDPTVVPVKDTTATTTVTKEKTPEEIKKCQDEAKANMLARREFDYKDSLISWIVWWSVFLILFVTHFPVFYRRYRLDSK